MKLRVHEVRPDLLILEDLDGERDHGRLPTMVLAPGDTTGFRVGQIVELRVVVIEEPTEKDVRVLKDLRLISFGPTLGEGFPGSSVEVISNGQTAE